MREAVLNGAGLAVLFSNTNEALDALDRVTSGLIFLVGRKKIHRQLWMQNPPDETDVCDGVNLRELFRLYRSRNRDKSSFLLGMVANYPIDDGIADGDIRSFVETEIEGLSDYHDLLWCAISGTKIIVSLTRCESWYQNPCSFRLLRNGSHTSTVEVENVFSEESAQNTVTRLNKLEISTTSPSELWKKRSILFSNLLFGKDVEKQLHSLGSDLFESAKLRLTELDRVASEWKKSSKTNPKYLIKNTGESAATLQKYRHERVFRSSSGQNEVYEKHARIRDGGRIHFREIPSQSKIEVGYVGTHLRIVSTN